MTPDLDNTELDRWLVAAWPGMGNVALLAASYLVEQLRALKVAELNPQDFFEVQSLDVRNGLVAPSRPPRSMFFEWTAGGRRELLIFIGEAQPATGGFKLCQQIVEYAVQHRAKRICTFAAMATHLQLGTQPRVFSVATELSLLNQIHSHGALTLEEGQIGGLNGVLLAAGAERGLAGTCLLGEMPCFAAGVPNPRAAEAILECFAGLAGIEIDLAALKRQADAVEQQLGELLEQMSRAATQAAAEAAEEEEEEDEGAEADQWFASGKAEAVRKPQLDPQMQRRIEALFAKARQDRSRAFHLKHELDRLGIFKQYEDRFLDLFRKAE
jgi:proteasome assembly chaperone (PAC2) family protein